MHNFNSPEYKGFLYFPSLGVFKSILGVFLKDKLLFNHLIVLDTGSVKFSGQCFAGGQIKIIIMAPSDF